MSESFWDSFSTTEARRNLDNPEDYVYFRLVLRALDSFLSSRDSVLDIGAGTGRFSLEVAPRVRQIEHLDFSQAMLDVAVREANSRGIANISFTKADARDLSRYRNSHFDKVLAINTPVSFAGRAWRSALSEVCRVAKGGVLFTVSNFVSAFPRVFDLAIRHGSPLGDLVEDFFKDRFFDAEKAKMLGTDLPSYQAFLPGEIEPELDRLGFRVQRVEGLAILCRLMNAEGLKAIVSDEALLAEFLDFEGVLAAAYRGWAPSREIMFVAEKRAA